MSRRFRRSGLWPSRRVSWMRRRGDRQGSRIGYSNYQTGDRQTNHREVADGGTHRGNAKTSAGNIERLWNLYRHFHVLSRPMYVCWNLYLLLSRRFCERNASATTKPNQSSAPRRGRFHRRTNVGASGAAAEDETTHTGFERLAQRADEHYGF